MGQFAGPGSVNGTKFRTDVKRRAVGDVLKLAVVQYLRRRAIDGGFDALQSVGLDGDDHELLDDMAYWQNSSHCVIFDHTQKGTSIYGVS